MVSQKRGSDDALSALATKKPRQTRVRTTPKRPVPSKVKATRKAKATAVASSSTVTFSHPSSATRRPPTYNPQQIAEFKVTRLIEFKKRLMHRLNKVSCTLQVEGLMDQSVIDNAEIEEADDESDGDEYVVSGSGIETSCTLHAMNNAVNQIDIQEVMRLVNVAMGLDPSDPNELTEDDDNDGKCSLARTHYAHLKNGLKHVENVITHAICQEVRFASFSHKKAVSDDPKDRAENSKQTEKESTTWDDGKSRTAVSNDGVQLVIHLPNFLKEAHHERLFEVLMVMGHTVKLTFGGADAKGRDNPSSYVHRPGELAGSIKLVSLWHSIGHSHEDPVISSGFIKSGKQFTSTTNTIDQMYSLSELVNWTLQLTDPAQYEALKKLKDTAIQENSFLRAMSTIDPLFQEGRAIMFNRQTPRHIDRLDPKNGWATMITFGTFKEGGICYIPRLKLKLRYLPRDVIMIRGRLLAHEVEAWGPGQRISIAHFTHDALWKSFGIECP